MLFSANDSVVVGALKSVGRELASELEQIYPSQQIYRKQSINQGRSSGGKDEPRSIRKLENPECKLSKHVATGRNQLNKAVRSNRKCLPDHPQVL